MVYDLGLPSTLTSMSSSRPPAWFMISELGKWSGPGPPRDTCGPVVPPLIMTVIGQPGTSILLKLTLMMCSHGSAGTNETANLEWKM